MDKLRRRLYVELALAIISSVLAILTAAIPDWIEVFTAIDLDHGSGGLEWILTGSLLVTALIGAALAGSGYRRLAAQRRSQRLRLSVRG